MSPKQGETALQAVCSSLTFLECKGVCMYTYMLQLHVWQAILYFYFLYTMPARIAMYACVCMTV